MLKITHLIYPPPVNMFFNIFCGRFIDIESSNFAAS